MEITTYEFPIKVSVNPANGMVDIFADGALQKLNDLGKPNMMIDSSRSFFRLTLTMSDSKQDIKPPVLFGSCPPRIDGKMYPRPSDERLMYRSEAMARLRACSFTTEPNRPIGPWHSIRIYSNPYGEHAPEGLKLLGTFPVTMDGDPLDGRFMLKKQDVYDACLKHGGNMKPSELLG